MKTKGSYFSDKEKFNNSKYRASKKFMGDLLELATIYLIEKE